MEEKELKALISLLDDPDMEIFNQVQQQLITSGPEVIPQLEASWESSFDPLSQTRIENIIHKIQFDQVQNDLQIWALQNNDDLLEGLLTINRYQYPNLDENAVHYQLAELRRNAWFQLMYEMSPLEKVKLLNNIIFREFGLSGNTTNYHDPQNSFLHKVLETKKGNPISLACIYSIIAQKLDIPIYGVNLPKHFIVAYIDEEHESPLFYINVFNRGQVMKHDDIFSFLKQLNLPPKEEYTLPCSNIAIIKRVLRNLTTAYDNLGNIEKREEVNTLLLLLSDFN
ncbi:Regulator of sirC expression, contains transglutaminase-like and TPR domains [Sphingobacterium nematocida]|uniref:Regulator of sirC expression, contains transglutaminase-like and TPR domains n=1 Tax=Sphingobacterium nematocida TaxID=1513896 RepID=A0A1T5BHR1_9SPHI|nr:transglutaminase-like domain-containing protein [Sphingobacterium nematocida]SKB46549.1 Regulator of sirC expression, contains transglutaminase-like and TPR domains [Sphingobacterium nematocida]